jgi:hypothetical protein
MRTTVEIPDPLLRRAKLAAVEEGITLRELITRGLETVLRSGKGRGFRLGSPPVKLSPDSPLRHLSSEGLAVIEAEEEAGEVNEVYRRR